MVENKLTLEDLLDRARQRDNDKIQIREYFSEELGGNIAVKKMPLRKLTAFLDKADDGDSNAITSNLDMNIELVYKSVPMLQNKELQAAYDCVEPYDIVTKVFNDNLGEIQDITNFIMSLYGMYKYKPRNDKSKQEDDAEEESLVDELKN